MILPMPACSLLKSTSRHRRHTFFTKVLFFKGAKIGIKKQKIYTISLISFSNLSDHMDAIHTENAIHIGIETDLRDRNHFS